MKVYWKIPAVLKRNKFLIKKVQNIFNKKWGEIFFFVTAFSLSLSLSLYLSFFAILFFPEIKYQCKNIFSSMWINLYSGTQLLFSELSISILNVSLQLWRQTNNKERAPNKIPCDNKDKQMPHLALNKIMLEEPMSNYYPILSNKYSLSIDTQFQ